MFLCCSVSSQVWCCFRQTCFCVAVFPLKCGVALDRHVSVLQCFLSSVVLLYTDMFLCCSVSSQVWCCFRQTCFCVAVFPLKCGVALDRHVSVLQCFLKCGVALGGHVSVLQCFLSSVALL